MRAAVSSGLALVLLLPHLALAQLPTTVQLPTFGISVDAKGVLEIRTYEDPTGELRRQRLAAAQAALPKDLLRASPLRKVSLRRLDAALKESLAASRKPDEAQRYLAGLQRISHVFLFPDDKDIVLAGPAQGWVADLSGRAVGIESGLAVLELADLAVALRAFPSAGPGTDFIGCTIDPTPEGLERLQKFQRTIPANVPASRKAQVAAQVAQGMRESLGMAKIRVFGVPADTHFAQVLVEADYRMKLIGIGLETPPVRIPSYLDLVGNSVREGTLHRWWFTPDYDCVRVSADRLAMELVGQGVQLQTEDKAILPGGGLGNTARPNRACELFAQTFTKKYSELAARSPVYQQLRNLVDLSILAAFLQKETAYERVAWRPTALTDERVYSVGGLPVPKEVAVVAVAVWKGNRLIAPAGGGVEVLPKRALEPERVPTDDAGRLGAAHGQIHRAKLDTWWWD